MAAVQFLLDGGAEVNAEDRWGNTALDEAVSARHDEVIKSVPHQHIAHSTQGRWEPCEDEYVKLYVLSCALGRHAERLSQILNTTLAPFTPTRSMSTRPLTHRPRLLSLRL